jgi:hypothetical protein
MSTPPHQSGDSIIGTPLGSQGNPADNKVSVVVTTTSESIAMLDSPTYENITTLEDKTISFAAQGTVMNPLQHMTQSCKRQIKMSLAMQDHKNKSDWETLSSKDLFKILKEIFPKKTDISGQTIYEYLSERSKLFDFNLFDQNNLVSQFCAVLTKLETLTIQTGDVKQAIKQLTRDIIHGVGGTEGSKRFLVNEVEKEKPLDLEAYFDFVLKTQFETRKVALEAIRRGILSNMASRTSGEQRKNSLESYASTDEPNLKKGRVDPLNPEEHHLCNGCGRPGHKHRDCIFVKHNHPDHNPDPFIPWHDCKAGVEWSKLGQKYLPARKCLSRKPFDYGPLNEDLKRMSN